MKKQATTSASIPVTGCAGHFPMLDRNGRQLHVGDRIRYQVCTGRYGQTAIGETTVADAHYEYGFIGVREGCADFHYDFDKKVLRGKHTHNDYEHGHETWVEIIE